MNGNDFSRLAAAEMYGIAIGVVLTALATWKVFDIIVWVCQHVSVTVSQ